MNNTELKLKIVANHLSEIVEDDSIEIYYTLTNIGKKSIINSRVPLTLTSASPSTILVRHPVYIEHLEPNESMDSEKFIEKPFLNGLMLLTPVIIELDSSLGKVRLYNEKENPVSEGQPISSYKVKSSGEIGQLKEINVALKGVWIAVSAVIVQVVLQLIDWYFQYFYLK